MLRNKLNFFILSRRQSNYRKLVEKGIFESKKESEISVKRIKSS